MTERFRKDTLMSMMNTGDILETIEMFTQDNLDVRTVTMGISLLDCIDPDPKKACEKIYNKITTKAADLVPAVEHISAEYGIPIINKRISVTPIAMLLGACPDADPVDFAKALDAAGKKVGVNFVGGYTALVHKGFSAGDRRLIESIPRALAETDIVCSSVNIGATKAGLNMDAIKLMGEAVKKASELTADRQCIGAAKLVVFCNAPEDNPFMAGAFHGPGEPDCEIHVGVSGPGAVRAALAKLPKDAPIDEVAELVKRTAFKITRVGQLVANLASKALGVPAGIIDLSLAPTPAVGDSVANILEEMGLETCGCCGNCKTERRLQDVTVPAQMLLSCVYRIYEKLGYFVGKTMVLRVLRGSRDKRILELGLDQISTYNLMREKRQELNALCDFLEADGYLRVNPEHSTLEPEERARDVLFRGKQLLMPVLASPEPAPKASQKGAKKQTAPLPSGADDLFGVLRETRMKIAQRENVPAYIVCSNSTLLDMAEKAPRSLSELLEVSGVGERKASRYGEAFLRTIEEYIQQQG